MLDCAARFRARIDRRCLADGHIAIVALAIALTAPIDREGRSLNAGTLPKTRQLKVLRPLSSRGGVSSVNMSPSIAISRFSVVAVS
jgi:hypothetical protein